MNIFKGLLAKVTFGKKQPETCACCGEKLTEENTVPVNNAEDICANCYAQEMMDNSYDAYEYKYLDR